MNSDGLGDKENRVYLLSVDPYWRRIDGVEMRIWCGAVFCTPFCSRRVAELSCMFETRIKLVLSGRKSDGDNWRCRLLDRGGNSKLAWAASSALAGDRCFAGRIDKARTTCMPRNIITASHWLKCDSGSAEGLVAIIRRCSHRMAVSPFREMDRQEIFLSKERMTSEQTKRN